MNRERLPNRRPCITESFRYNGRTSHGTVSFYDAACTRPGEIFLDVAKAGTDLRAAASGEAVLASLAMQRGSTIPEIRHSLPRFEDGTAADPLGQFLDGFVKGGQG